MAQPCTFVVGDNPDGDRNGDDVLVERKFNKYTMFWAMSFEDLVELQTSIQTYIAGERLG